jgi:hypothetical protein
MKAVVSDAMAYEFHDTAHIEKRARERSFTVEKAMLAINQSASNAGAKWEITADSFGCSPVRLK